MKKVEKMVEAIEVVRDGSKLVMFGSVGAGAGAAVLHAAGVIVDSVALSWLKGTAIGAAVSCGVNVATSILWAKKSEEYFKAEFDEKLNDCFEDPQPEEEDEPEVDPQQDAEDPQQEERAE